MSYQGWTNPQTWCLALTMDNTKEHQDFMIENYDNLEALKTYCYTKRGDIFHMAMWAWPEAYQADQVNWTEIQNHYKDKQNE